MKQVTWTQFLCVLAIAIAMYYGLLYFFGKRRRNSSTAFHRAQSRIPNPRVSPTHDFRVIEQKDALPEFLKYNEPYVTPVVAEVVKSITEIEYTAAEDAVPIVLSPDDVPDHGIDLESLISTFDLASKNTVTAGENENLIETASALYDDAYFQQLLTGNETIRQKVEWALMHSDGNGQQPGRLIYHTQEAVA